MAWSIDSTLISTRSYLILTLPSGSKQSASLVLPGAAFRIHANRYRVHNRLAIKHPYGHRAERENYDRGSKKLRQVVQVVVGGLFLTLKKEKEIHVQGCCTFKSEATNKTVVGPGLTKRATDSWKMGSYPMISKYLKFAGLSSSTEMFLFETVQNLSRLPWEYYDTNTEKCHR